ncbi:MAG: flippase [Gemmatimonadaceae bacterium]|nr:flippase [Gloeobacterales cyanobacterium ES-bin-141]
MGSRSRNIFVNASALVVATLLTRVVSVSVVALLVRTLSTGDFARYSYLTSFVGMFAALATLGLPSYLSREVVQQPQRAPTLLKTAYILQIVFSVVSTLLILVLGGSGRNSSDIWLLLLSTFGMVTATTATLFLYTINGLNRSYITAVVTVISSLLNTLGLLLVIAFKPDLEALIWVYFLSGVIQHILSFLAFRWFFKELKFATGWPGFQDFKSVFLDSLPYVFLVAFTTIYFRIDIVLLEAWSTLAQVAQYSAAYKFIEIVSILVSLIGTVFFAEFSNMQAQGNQNTGMVLKRGLRYMVLIALPLAALISFYARDILFIFYGDKYLQSTAMLQVLSWTTVFLFARNLQTGLVQAHNYVTIQVFVFAASSLLNVGLNYLFIPTQGGFGAAVATLICEVFNFLAFSYFIYAKFGIVLIERWIAPTALAFAAMLAVLGACTAVPAGLGISLAILTFGGVLYLSGGLLPEDAGMWRRVTAKLTRKSSPG